MAVTPLQFLWMSATQGSADAFVQSTVATGLYGQTKTAYLVRELVMEWPAAVNAANWEFEIGIKTAAAMSNMADKTLLFRFKRQSLFTTSGGQVFDLHQRFVFSTDESFLFVSDPIYFRFDSNATSASNTAYLRMGYQQVTLNDVDRLSLLASSLS
jgi:hypothetical protein